MTDDYIDEFFDTGPGITIYSIKLYLIERGSEQDMSDPNDPFDLYYMNVREQYEAEVEEDFETLSELYDHRVYDLRNTTLGEVLNNENEDASFRTISIHDVSYEYNTEEVEEDLESSRR